MGVIFLSSVCLGGTKPATPFYPFGSTDLATIRTISQAEKIPDSPDLKLAWQIYSQVQGSWKPGASKPEKQVLDNLAELKRKLEDTPKPKWLEDALKSYPPKKGNVHFPDKVGDETFVEQKDSVEFQNQKALGIIYLAEHELDRPDAAQSAGRYLTVLSLKHPWDWELHALYARLLVDSGAAEPAFRTAVAGIFMNPKPDLEDFQFLAFVAMVYRRDQPEVVLQIIKDAAVDEKTGEEAAKRASELFKSKGDVRNVPLKGPPSR